MLTPQLMGSPANVQDGIALANAIVDTVRDPLVVLDQNLRVITASRSFYNTFRLTRDDVHGLLLYEIDGGQWDIPELRELLGDLKRQSHCGGL
ncbi:MAG: PAS domain-containing protein [Pseudolabrys sp.]